MFNVISVGSLENISTPGKSSSAFEARGSICKGGWAIVVIVNPVLPSLPLILLLGIKRYQESGIPPGNPADRKTKQCTLESEGPFAYLYQINQTSTKHTKKERNNAVVARTDTCSSYPKPAF